MFNNKKEKTSKTTTANKIATLNIEAQLIYEEQLSKSKKYITILFPDYTISTVTSTTCDVTSCCVVIFFSDHTNVHAICHYNSTESTYANDVKSNIFTTDIPYILQTIKPKKAMVIGGNETLFTKIYNYIRSSNISLAASYLDEQNKMELEDSFYSKFVIFNPETKSATIISSCLPHLKLELKNQHILLAKDFPNHYDQLKELAKSLNTSSSDEDENPIVEKTSSPQEKSSSSQTNHM